MPHVVPPVLVLHEIISSLPSHFIRFYLAASSWCEAGLLWLLHWSNACELSISVCNRLASFTSNPFYLAAFFSATNRWFSVLHCFIAWHHKMLIDYTSEHKDIACFSFSLAAFNAYFSSSLFSLFLFFMSSQCESHLY